MDYQCTLLEDGRLIALVHYLMEIGGVERVACMPGLEKMSAQESGRPYPIRRTEDPRAVSCPLCERTAACQAAHQGHEATVKKKSDPGRVAVHFFEVGQAGVACLEKTVVHRTEDPRGVSCLLCRRTPAWESAHEMAPKLVGRKDL